MLNKKQVLKVIAFILIIVAIILLFINKTSGVILLFAGIWLHPKTDDVLCKLNIYLLDTIKILIGVLLIAFSCALFIINPTKIEIHKCVASDWVYDEESNLEIQKCESCGEILNKRSVDLEYSTLDINDIEDNKETTEEEISEILNDIENDVMEDMETKENEENNNDTTDATINNRTIESNN